MKRLFALAARTLAAALLASGQGVAKKADGGRGPERQASRAEREILALEKEAREVAMRNDPDALTEFQRRVLADEIVYTAVNGEVFDKARTLSGNLAFIKSGWKVESDEAEDERVRVYGDIAVYTCRETYTLHSPEGQASTSTSRAMDVFIKRQGRWQVVASQVTSVRQPAPAATPTTQQQR